MPTTKPRFTITVSESMLKEIDDYRYVNRYPTRTQAVNELFRIGLKAIEKNMVKMDSDEETQSKK